MDILQCLMQKIRSVEVYFLYVPITDLPSSGPIVRLNLAGTEMLILNELEDIDELVRCCVARQFALWLTGVWRIDSW